MNYPIIIGITGPIGSGKTTFCTKIVKKDSSFFYINADKIVDELYRPYHQGWKRLKQIIGSNIFFSNDKINRKNLADFVFYSEKNRIIIEKLIHPLVFQKINKLIKENSNKKLILIEAIKFYPKNDIPDYLIVIKAPFNKVQSRYKKRYNPSLLKYMYKAFKHPNKSDMQINNNKSLITYKKNIESLFQNKIKTLYLALQDS